MIFPDDVRGWLTEEEGHALAALASGKSVLEIGSYCGRSTVCMAQTAEHVTAVDPFDGRGTPEPMWTHEEFLSNIARYGVAGKVTTCIGTSEEVKLPTNFGFAFIDGAHDYSSVVSDVNKALCSLTPGSLIAFHDYRATPGEYDGRRDEGVTAAVNSLLNRGAKIVSRHGSIAVLNVAAMKTAAESSLVALAMAKRSRGISDDGAAEAFYRCPCRRNQVVALIKPISSLLTHSFNQAWAGVLDLRDTGVDVRYFAMLHDDIAPDPWWVDTLIDELERLDADVVSAVVPIKGPDGTTSTAVYTGDIWLPRRLTMTEIMELPETFGEEDAGGPLLLNTGCWVADITKPWADEVCFDFMNRIRRAPSGERFAECVPEDWLNSHRLNELGCKLYATRKVKLEHHGNGFAANSAVWGWKTDKVYQRLSNERQMQCVSSS